MVEDNAGRVCQCAPSVGSWSTVEYEDRLDSVSMGCQLRRVVEDLAEPEADLLSLVGSRQRLDLRDVHPAAMRPTEIELRPTAVGKVWFDANRTQCTRQPAHRLLVGCRPTVERVEVNDEAGIPADSSPRPCVCVERLGKDSVDRSRNDLDAGSTKAEPTATRWTSMNQVGETGSVDDMHMTTTSAVVLCKHELLAVLPRAIDHRTAGEVPMDDEGYRIGRSVAPLPPPTLHMTTALGLRHALAIDQHPPGEDHHLTPKRADPTVAPPCPSHMVQSRIRFDRDGCMRGSEHLPKLTRPSAAAG